MAGASWWEDVGSFFLKKNEKIEMTLFSVSLYMVLSCYCAIRVLPRYFGAYSTEMKPNSLSTVLIEG
jgi:hypothetical protein